MTGFMSLRDRFRSFFYAFINIRIPVSLGVGDEPL
jgi:hypothetical protein